MEKKKKISLKLSIALKKLKNLKFEMQEVLIDMNFILENMKERQASNIKLEREVSTLKSNL